ncbi:CLUMA_CG011250, isoform A [Clunio marinus]|uniref:CLUMA_CG011250, isoform A n=1 Tax=Clunio marinus TaxID=568069 RepID=A0A1J1ICF5_9DIPT|nr:CLUMA_CG011250, isoform A [Clunio marinus]
MQILKKEIEAKWDHEKQNKNPTVGLNSIAKDFKFYDQHKKKGQILEKLNLSLCSTQPTSTQSERNFSLAASFICKQRTSLFFISKHADMLFFLKIFFINNNVSS